MCLLLPHGIANFRVLWSILRAGILLLAERCGEYQPQEICKLGKSLPLGIVTGRALWETLLAGNAYIVASFACWHAATGRELW